MSDMAKNEASITVRLLRKLIKRVKEIETADRRSGMSETFRLLVERGIAAFERDGTLVEQQVGRHSSITKGDKDS